MPARQCKGFHVWGLGFGVQGGFEDLGIRVDLESGV